MNFARFLIIIAPSLWAMKRARDPLDNSNNNRNVRVISQTRQDESDPRSLPLDITNLLLSKYLDIKDIPALSQTSAFLRSVCHDMNVSTRIIVYFEVRCNLLYSSRKSLIFLSQLVPFVQSYVRRNGPLVPKLVKTLASFLAVAYDSKPVFSLGFRLLPVLDAQGKTLFQRQLIKMYQNSSDDLDYYYERNDLFGACCKMPLRTETDLDLLFGPLLLGSDVHDQVFILLWAFNLLDLENESMSVILPLSELDPYGPFIKGALWKIADLLSLVFEFLDVEGPFRQNFVEFFRKKFDVELPSVNLSERILADPNLMFIIIEVIWAMQYKDQGRVQDRFQLLAQRFKVLQPVYDKWSAVMNVVESGDTLCIPFECDLQRNLYKMIWLSKHRQCQSTHLSEKMKTPLYLCMDATLDPEARDWLVSDILMLSPDSHIYKMIIALRLGQEIRPDGPMWLQIFPSTNVMYTFFTLLERINEDDIDAILDVWRTFERVVDEFRQALENEDAFGVQLFDDAMKMEPFVKALRHWTITPDQAFLRQTRPQIFPQNQIERKTEE